MFLPGGRDQTPKAAHRFQADQVGQAVIVPDYQQKFIDASFFPLTVDHHVLFRY